MTSKQAEVLVIGATGTVGREVARAAATLGGRVRALVRSEERVSGLPAGTVPVLGNLCEPRSLNAAATGVRTAFYVSPHEPDEEQLCENVVRACEANGVRLVFVGVHADAPTVTGRAVRRFVHGRMLPHYRPKFRLSERVRTSRTEPVLLMPTNFYQNDELFMDDLVAGSFTQPFERAVNRVDVRDLAVIAARALLEPGFPAGAHPIVGPESLDAFACAAVWSEALGRRVRHDSDPARAQVALARALDGKKREDFLATYRVIRRFALPTCPEQLSHTAALLGRKPTPYSAYVRDTLARLDSERSQSNSGPCSSALPARTCATHSAMVSPFSFFS